MLHSYQVTYQANFIAYRLVASYTLPYVPRPKSFPFSHWPFVGDIHGLSILLWMVHNSGCLWTPGGRGSGWTSMLLPSVQARELSGRDLWWECTALLLWFLVLLTGFGNVGLLSGEWSALFITLVGESWKEYWASEGDDGWWNGGWKRSCVLNLFGLGTGLVKPLPGALLAGTFSLNSTPSAFRSWGNHLRR